MPEIKSKPASPRAKGRRQGLSRLPLEGVASGDGFAGLSGDPLPRIPHPRRVGRTTGSSLEAATIALYCGCSVIEIHFAVAR
jgi:hypothetical protein